MRLVHRAGDRVPVDWAGDTIELIYSKTGDISKVCIFVATLPASNCRYVEAFLSMELDSWITGHVHAFSFFRSVPRIIPCDNTRTAII
jgi:transposase